MKSKKLHSKIQLIDVEFENGAFCYEISKIDHC